MRLGLDQAVDLRERGAQIAVSDKSRSRARNAPAGWCPRRIAARHRVGAVDEAGKLGAHQVVARLQLRRILLVPVGAFLGDAFERGDAFRRHRMRLQIGVDGLRGEQFLVGEPLEGVVHALGGLAGGGEELDAGAVGLLLLRALVGRAASGGSSPAAPRMAAAPDCRRLTAASGAAATIAPTPSSIAMIDCVCACASCWRIATRWPPAMWPVSCASTPMISFGSWIHQGAGIDEDALAVGDEGVEGAVVDDDDLDVLRPQARRLRMGCL